VTITHTKDLAAAVVVLTGAPLTDGPACEDDASCSR
jgi:hypothetical protein